MGLLGSQRTPEHPQIADEHGATHGEQADAEPRRAPLGFDKAGQCDFLIVQHEDRQFLAIGQVGCRPTDEVLRGFRGGIPRIGLNELELSPAAGFVGIAPAGKANVSA